MVAEKHSLMVAGTNAFIRILGARVNRRVLGRLTDDAFGKRPLLMVTRLSEHDLTR